MYGFLHCALEDFIVKNYGPQVWQDVVKKCGVKLRGGSFLSHRVYSDELSFQLFKSATECLGLDLDVTLEKFGCHFLSYCNEMGFEQLLRALGSNLYDFLTNLDNLHDHLGSIYPGMKAPSFRVTASPVEEEVLHLHYYSSRRGLHPLVRGLVKAAAVELFETPVYIRTQSTSRCQNDRDREHVVLEIRPCCPASSSKGRRRHSITPFAMWPQLSTSPANLPLTVSTFVETFPFHLVTDKNLILRQLGKGLRRFVGHLWTNGPVRFDQVFVVTRPVVDMEFQAIMRASNMVFVVQTKEGVLKRTGTSDETLTQSLRLKGQMISLPESESLLFLCSPRVTDLEEMQSLGLYLSDFPLHDRTRDLLLMSYQRRGQRELYWNMEETTNNLKILEAKRREDKRKTEDILMSIFPPKVAMKLCHDEPVEAEHFDLVTCLVSDIVGFTAMCGNDHVDPIDVVRMLNRLYLQFDALSQVHGVYKLETIGDAYIVVAGIPQFLEGHADRILDMAFGMVSVTKHILSPMDNQSIHVRIGVNTGPVIGGVVGVKMPRYCLFGNTVTMANILESLSQPGRITLSEVTKSHLKKDVYQFEENPAGRSLSLKCYMAYKEPTEEPSDYNLHVFSGLNTSGGHFRSPSSSPVPSEQVTPNGSGGSPTSRGILQSSMQFERRGSRRDSKSYLSSATDDESEIIVESRSPSPTMFDFSPQTSDSKPIPRICCPGSLVLGSTNSPSILFPRPTTFPHPSSTPIHLKEPKVKPSSKVTSCSDCTNCLPQSSAEKATDIVIPLLKYQEASLDSPDSTSETEPAKDSLSNKKKALPSLFWWAKRSPSSVTLPETSCSHIEPQPRRRGRSLESSLQLLSYSNKLRNRRSLLVNSSPRRNCSCNLKKLFGLCRHKLDTTYSDESDNRGNFSPR